MWLWRSDFKLLFQLNVGVSVFLPQLISLTECLENFLDLKLHLRYYLGLNRLRNMYELLGRYVMLTIIPKHMISLMNGPISVFSSVIPMVGRGGISLIFRYSEKFTKGLLYPRGVFAKIESNLWEIGQITP